MRLEGLRRWLAEILWPKLHELDVICEMNRVAADVVNVEWRKDRERVGILERKVKRLENENANLKMWISDAKIALDGGWDGPSREVQDGVV